MKLMFRAISSCITALLLPSAALAFCFEDAGNTYRLNPRLLKNIASLESGMNPAAVHRNRDGSLDFGLMQVNSFWINATHLDKERLVRDPCYNTLAGARILRDCIDRLGYTWEAIGCYNATSGDKRRSYAWKVFRHLSAEEKPNHTSVIVAPKAPYEEMTDGKWNNVSLTFTIDNQDSTTHRLP